MEWTAEHIATVKRMRAEGESNLAIAKHFKSTRSAIGGLFHRLKLTPAQLADERSRYNKRGGPPYTADPDDDRCQATETELVAAALVADGASFVEAAAELDMPIAAVRKAVESSKVRERAEMRRGAVDRLTAWARNGPTEANNKRLRRARTMTMTPEQVAAKALMGQADTAQRRRDSYRRQP